MADVTKLAERAQNAAQVTVGRELTKVERDVIEMTTSIVVNAMRDTKEAKAEWLEGFKLGKATSRVALEQFFTTMRANSVPDKEAVDMLFMIYERFGGLSDA